MKLIKIQDKYNKQIEYKYKYKKKKIKSNYSTIIIFLSFFGIIYNI
jgi:hypothetical protein